MKHNTHSLRDRTKQTIRRHGFRRLVACVPLVLLFAPLAGAEPSADEQLCAMLEESAKTANAEAPLMVDDFTREDGTVFSCATKTIETKQTIVVPVISLPPDWQAEKQATLNAVHCDDPATADVIEHGWTIAQTTTLPDGTIVTMKAVCE